MQLNKGINELSALKAAHFHSPKNLENELEVVRSLK